MTKPPFIPAKQNTLELFLALLLTVFGFWILGYLNLHIEEELSRSNFLSLCVRLCLAFLIALLIATRLRALGNIVHECSHGLFAKNPQTNHFWGTLICIFLLQSFRKYKADHRSHHTHLKVPALDRDLARYHELFFQNKNINEAEGPCANTVFKQLRIALKPKYLRVGYAVVLWHADDAFHINALRIVWAIMMVLSFFIAARHIPIFVLALSVSPVLLFYPIICVWSDIADHYSPAVPSRNHLFGSKFLNLVFFPRNDAYHLIHHLYPKQPVSEYPLIHRKLIAERPEYKHLNHTLRFL